MCGFYEAPARTVSSSSGLRRRRRCMCAQIYFRVYTRASPVRPFIRVFTCTRHTIYVHLERSHWSQRCTRDTRNNESLVQRFEPLLYKKKYEIVVEKKKKNILNTHAGITGEIARTLGGLGRGPNYRLLLLPRVSDFSEIMGMMDMTRISIMVSPFRIYFPRIYPLYLIDV